MLALILVEAQMDASFVVGGDLSGVGTNAVWDDGEWLVVEADESDGSFLALQPEIAVVTNVEADHLDYYGNFDALRGAFDRFCASARLRVVGGDDEVAAAIGRAHGADLVGVGAGCTHRLARLEIDRSSVSFDLVFPDESPDLHLEVPVPGAYNARNAAVAAVTAITAGSAATGRGRRVGPLRGGGPTLRVPRLVPRGDASSTTTGICPVKCAPSWPRPKAVDGAGWWPSSSPTASLARPSSAVNSARLSPMPTWW